MNWQEVAAHWAQVIPSIKEKWAKVSDEALLGAGDKRDLLASELEKQYGIQRNHAELQIDRFVEKLRAAGSPTAVPDVPAAGEGA
jgi:uncharacterized protein YjbJ (UPF0337 family)